MTGHDEARAAGRLAGEALSGLVGVVRDMHTAIDSRVERHLPPPGRPVVGAQRAVALAVYHAVSLGQRTLAEAVAAGVDAARPEDAPSVSRTSWGRVAVPAVNGLWGDHVAAQHPALAIPMGVRVDGRDVPVEAAAVAAAFPAATSRLAVFVHGLAESEEAWLLRLHDGEGDEALPYGARLQADLGVTPVYVRYNSGLRVSDNGAALSGLLDGLLASWPVPVEQVSLVGHSMGGLVARSACRDGEKRGLPWVDRVRTVVTLGTPHLGAPLEKAVHVTEWVLRRFPETRPLTRVISSRSVGTRDLGHGRVVEEDWLGHDPEEFLRDTCTEVPFLSHATYCFVAGSVTRDLAHPFGRLVGDGLVRYPSAAGIGTIRRQPLPMHEGAHLPAVHHLALLHHPAVYALLREWLARPAASTAVDAAP